MKAKTLKNCHSIVLGTTRTGKPTMLENLMLMINTNGDQSPAAAY
jgi:type IV secretory pathway ATPase VirB11/archaellum biosynthesis ATPase